MYLFLFFVNIDRGLLIFIDVSILLIVIEGGVFESFEFGFNSLLYIWLNYVYYRFVIIFLKRCDEFIIEF